MGDLKTPWDSKDQAFSGTDLSGAGVVSSGNDPNADGGGEGGSGLQPAWTNPILSNFDKAESSNSVSGLPALPNRFEPSESTNDIPDLTDRSPGTIDKK